MTHKIYKLTEPITIAGNTITQLAFRERVVAGDMRGIKLGSLADAPTDDILKIAGRLCAQPDAVMNALVFPDLLAVTELVGGFLDRGQETGTTGSP